MPVSPRARKVLKGTLCIAGAASLIYVGFLAYALYFWPPFPDLPREVAEVMSSDAIAFVPKTEEGISVLLRGKGAEPMKDRATLIAWLCGASVPRNTSVVFTETERAQGVLQMRVVRIARPSFAIDCPTTARFYAVRDGQIGGAHE
jgi:hypothetical protein